MARKLSPAQRANQITYFLTGDLKRIQVAYLRVGAKLAMIRDEKLYRALKYDSLEDYAEKRLRLGRASLYRYLQIYEWVRKSHGGWLAKHPKGFIPDLSGAFEIIWIEKQLESSALGAATRTELEAMRRKALAGELIRRRAVALDDFPAQALRDIDETLDLLKSASGALERVAVLGKARGTRLSEVGRKSLL